MAVPLFDSAQRQLLEESVLLFNQQDFFTCHERLEDVWRPLPKEHPCRLFLQGWIQVAVGFHHWGNGNRTGAVNLLTAGLEKLAPIPDGWSGVLPYDWHALIIDSRLELARIVPETFLPERNPPGIQ